MKTHVDKAQENSSKAVSDAPLKTLGNNESELLFVDNRPEATAQRKLQEMVNTSPRTKQFKGLQEKVNKTPKTATDAQPQKGAHPHQAPPPIQQHENNTDLSGHLKIGNDSPPGIVSGMVAQLEAHRFAPPKIIILTKGSETIRFQIDQLSPRLIQERYKAETGQLLMPQDMKAITDQAWETREQRQTPVEVVLRFHIAEPARPNQDIEALSEESFGSGLSDYWLGQDKQSGLRSTLRETMQDVDVSSISDKEVEEDIERQRQARKSRVRERKGVPVAPSNYDLTPNRSVKQHVEKMISDEAIHGLLDNVGLMDEVTEPKPILQGAYMSGDRNAVSAALVFNKRIKVLILYDELVNEHGHAEASKEKANVLKAFYLKTLKNHARNTDEEMPDPASRIILEKVPDASAAFSMRSGGIAKASVREESLALIDFPKAVQANSKVLQHPSSCVEAFEPVLKRLMRQRDLSLEILYVDREEEMINTKTKALNLGWKYLRSGDIRNSPLDGRVHAKAVAQVSDEGITTKRVLEPIKIPASNDNEAVFSKTLSWLIQDKDQRLKVLYSTNAEAPNAVNDTKNNAVALAWSYLKQGLNRGVELAGRVTAEAVEDAQDEYKTQVSSLGSTGESPGVATTVVAHAFGEDHEIARETLENAWLGGMHQQEKERLDDWWIH